MPKAERKNKDVGFKVKFDEIFKKNNTTGYAFAKNVLHGHPNTITPSRTPGYDPKLSTLLRIAKHFKCDINDLFDAEGYSPNAPTKPLKDKSKD